MASVTQVANSLTPPRFAAEWLGPATLLPGGAKLVAAGFTTYTIKINQADVAEGDTEITVDALPVAVAAGTILDFGQHTTGDISMFAKVTAAADAGDTTLTVEELAHAIENDAEATYTVTVTTVAAGYPVGRTYAERAAGTDFGPAGDSDDEVYLTAWDVTNLTLNNDVELIKPGTVIYEDLIPTWADLSATVKGKLRSAYVMISSSGN